MHHRHPCFVLACFLLIAGGITASAFGQLPAEIVTSADPSQQKGVIDTFVAAQTGGLLSADPASWAAGRNMLISQVAKQGATPAFFDVYAESVNTKLLPLATNKDARIRLN